MSLKQHLDAKLGDLAPRFPHSIAILNLVYGSFSKRSSQIREICAKVPGFVELIDSTTTDDYDWFWVAEFMLDSGGFATVAFPWKQDWSMFDGTTMDRSIAVYAKPDIPGEEITKLLKRIISAFGYP